jgi:hypothetical protein
MQCTAQFLPNSDLKLEFDNSLAPESAFLDLPPPMPFGIFHHDLGRSAIVVIVCKLKAAKETYRPGAYQHRLTPLSLERACPHHTPERRDVIEAMAQIVGIAGRLVQDLEDAQPFARRVELVVEQEEAGWLVNYIEVLDWAQSELLALYAYAVEALECPSDWLQTHVLVRLHKYDAPRGCGTKKHVPKKCTICRKGDFYAALNRFNPVSLDFRFEPGSFRPVPVTY